MRPSILALLVLAACQTSDGGEAPTLTILSPAEGDTVAVGEVQVSVIVENFELFVPGTARLVPFDPTTWLSPAAWAHGDEASTRGWISMTLDDDDASVLGATQGSLSNVMAGSHALTLQLIHEDGDPVEPAVAATVTFSAE